MNILICDDIRDEALELEDAIKASGFEGNIICFDNGKNALAGILSGAKIDVCFLDILMPEMKGTELAQKMREAGFKGEVVFLTSTNEYAAEACQKRETRFGRNIELVVKPKGKQLAIMVR